MGRKRSFSTFSAVWVCIASAVMTLATDVPARSSPPKTPVPSITPVSFLPGTLAFGNQVAGNTSAPLTTQLTNQQSVPLTISSIATIGGTAPSDYFSATTCPLAPNTLGPGQSCTISVSFAPSALGSRVSSLVVADDASNTPQTAQLKGTGTSPVTLSANNRVFMSRMVGTTSGIQSVMLTNNLATQIVFSSISATGDFAVATNTCGSGIAAGAQCTLGITFTPAALGSRQGTGAINYGGVGSPALITLSGSGNDSTLISITVTPSNLSVISGSSQQFTATGTLNTASSVDLTPYVTWNSSNTSVATIAPTGLATSLAAGSTTMTATLGTFAGATAMNVEATAPPISPIPSSYFGMIITPGSSFPLALNYGSFRVWNSGKNSQWEGLQVCNSTSANCQQFPAANTSLNTSSLDAMLASVYAPPPLGPGIQDGVLFTLNRTPNWATKPPGYSDWQPGYAYTTNTYVIPTVNNPGSYVFVALNTGTSGTVEPAPWNQTRNGMQSDGAVNWQNIGEFTKCSFTNGSCLVPPDLNPDGSGSNQIWDNWITQIAGYLNNPTYLQNHPHIKYWEPLNEWFVNDTVNFNNWGGGETNATFAQILRLTEDTRCIILGAGTIHNYPAQGGQTSCLGTPGYLQTLQGEGIGSGAAIDPTALIVEPSNDPNSAADMTLSQNFLYCNASPALDYNGTSTCTWAPPGVVANCNPSSCWGSAAIDILNYHFYDYRTQPEVFGSLLTKMSSFTSTADQSKPIVSGEGGDGCDASSQTNCPSAHIWQDDASRAGFIPRFYALDWSFGMSNWPPNGIIANWWHAYNASGVLYSNGALTPEGIAYNTTYEWLAGSVPASNPFCAAGPNPNTGKNTIYTCPLTSNGSPALLVWDSEFGPGGTYGTPYADCSTSPTPTVCGNTLYPVPTAFGGWYDINYSVDGTRNPVNAGQVTIGAVPILLVP